MIMPQTRLKVAGNKTQQRKKNKGHALYFFSIFQKNTEEAWLNKFLAETVGYRALAQETYGKARDGEKRG